MYNENFEQYDDVHLQQQQQQQQQQYKHKCYHHRRRCHCRQQQQQFPSCIRLDRTAHAARLPVSKAGPVMGAVQYDTSTINKFTNCLGHSWLFGFALEMLDHTRIKTKSIIIRELSWNFWFNISSSNIDFLYVKESMIALVNCAAVNYKMLLPHNWKSSTQARRASSFFCWTTLQLKGVSV